MRYLILLVEQIFILSVLSIIVWIFVVLVTYPVILCLEIFTNYQADKGKIVMVTFSISLILIVASFAFEYISKLKQK
jgi:hypothetical protein